jgi:hypothetical protein
VDEVELLGALRPPPSTVRELQCLINAMLFNHQQMLKAGRQEEQAECEAAVAQPSLVAFAVGSVLLVGTWA